MPVTAGILSTKASTSRRAALRVAARRLDQARGHALLVVEQRLHQMRRRDPLVMFAHRDRLRRLQEAACPIGEFLEIHAFPSNVEAMWCVSDATQGLSAGAASESRLRADVGGRRASAPPPAPPGSRSRPAPPPCPIRETSWRRCGSAGPCRGRARSGSARRWPGGRMHSSLISASRVTGRSGTMSTAPISLWVLSRAPPAQALSAGLR